MKDHFNPYVCMQFQKRRYAKLEQFHCGKKGYGLKSLEDISQGNFLIEYVGEVSLALFFSLSSASLLFIYLLFF